MVDLAGAYHDARMTMSALARDADDSARSTHVPACPDWTVRDLIVHVTSIATALSAGELPPDVNLTQVWDADMSRVREDWIASALGARRETPLEDVLAEWDTSGALVESMLRGEQPFPEGSPPLVEWIIVTDIGVHLQDLNGALGTQVNHDALASGLALRSYVEGMRMRATHEGLPAFRIRAGSREWVIGAGEPIATVTAEPFELARAAAGRRSPDQIRAYDWDGDPEPFIALFYPYGLRSDALVE
ncbi:MAG: maleylpyruvate isomerase family mycothiol-dependent enzyme [Actinomycetota bacterium]